MNRYRPGDEVTATLDDTTGATVTATLTLRRVDRLGCGCQRLAADRPGPDQGRWTCRHVHLHTGCARHPREVNR
ncbi:hypothetical protein [Micromonospora carbonacea]|uniref:Uncharacterized protein n=1 Tax=Micromonospora carbonacea TaxID=47853 RepID=A0A1C4WYV8_9ACTN|nr:hypothetical protein [Micromonospora carbonacea]SCF01051.1 hypothetical protein GA0070563_104104 [Micromonospora carbonacea]